MLLPFPPRKRLCAKLGKGTKKPIHETFPRFLEVNTLVHQPSCDYRSAYSEDEELEHQGEPMIWFEPVDAENTAATARIRIA